MSNKSFEAPEVDIEKFESTKQIVEYLKKELNSIGMEIVDASIYPSTKQSEESHDTGIVAGYEKGKAAVFTVDFHFSKGGWLQDYIFSISGQLKEGRGGERERFLDISRSPVGAESFGPSRYGGFSINHYEPSSHISAQDKIERGKKFFEDFLAKHGDELEERFTRHTHLWFVPEYSDAIAELEEKNGKGSDKNYTPFNEKVMKKFPKGFFSEDQKP